MESIIMTLGGVVLAICVMRTVYVLGKVWADAEQRRAYLHHEREQERLKLDHDRQAKQLAWEREYPEEVERRAREERRRERQKNRDKARAITRSALRKQIRKYEGTFYKTRLKEAIQALHRAEAKWEKEDREDE